VDINCGWFDSENLVAGGPTNHGGSSDTILKIVVELNITPQNGL